MEIRRERVPLFFAAITLALLHSQFLSPGVVTIPAGFDWIHTIYEALDFLPAFAALIFFCAAIPWKPDRTSRLLHMVLLAGTVCHTLNYARLLLWDNQHAWLQTGSLLAPAALLLALRRWLKEQPHELWQDELNNVVASCDALLGLLTLGLLSDGMWLLHPVFAPSDSAQFPYSTMFTLLVRGSLRLGGIAYRLWPVAVVILLITLLRPMRNAMKIG
ncbi:MAG: hypothetical protein IJA84_07585 [Clostridia bacterium]|nr:hypothetical protein [Clostridia bacterium]